MSESEHPSPNPPDPLLGSGSFIEVEESGSPDHGQHQPAINFGSVHVIDATPISMVAPDDVSAEVTPKVGKRRNIEEMSKRPSWLPDDWKMDLRVRSSGASSGVIDRYFFDPSGCKFRSQNEVMHFLETGKKLKRHADEVPSGSTRTQKPKKPGNVKHKKNSEAFKVGTTYPSDDLNGVLTSSPQKI